MQYRARVQMDGHVAGASATRGRAARSARAIWLAAAAALAAIAGVAVAWTGAWRRMYRLAAAKLGPGTWTDWVPAADGPPGPPSPPTPVVPARTAWTREYLDVYEATAGAGAGDASPDARSAAECRRECDARPFCGGYAFGADRGCQLFWNAPAASNRGGRGGGVICARASRLVPAAEAA